MLKMNFNFILPFNSFKCMMLYDVVEDEVTGRIKLVFKMQKCFQRRIRLVCDSNEQMIFLFSIRNQLKLYKLG